MIPDVKIKSKDFLDIQLKSWHTCDSTFDQFTAIPCRLGINELSFLYKTKSGYYPFLYKKVKLKDKSTAWVETGKPLDIPEIKLSKDQVESARKKALNYCSSWERGGDSKGFESCLFGIDDFEARLSARQMANSDNILNAKAQQEAEDYFRSTHQLSTFDKFKDLLETAKETRYATPISLKWWKQDIKHRDLKGVDTYDINKATAFEQERVPHSLYGEDLVDAYIKADGDISSFKTIDKPYKESIKDEMESVLLEEF